MADAIDVADGLARGLRSTAGPDPSLLEEAARIVLAPDARADCGATCVLATLFRGAVRRLASESAAGTGIEPSLAALARGAPVDVLLGRRSHDAWKPIAAMLESAALRQVSDPRSGLPARALAAFASAVRGGAGFARFASDHAGELPADGSPLLAAPGAPGAGRTPEARARSRFRWNT